MNENINLIANDGFTECEKEQFTRNLAEALKHQVEKYNGLDSTSVTEEKAQELLTSLLFTAKTALNGGVSKENLLQDFNGTLKKGQQLLLKKKTEAKIEFQLLMRDLPKIENVYFNDTVANLALFFKKYDVYYGAHEIPCSIDYPLLFLLDETEGISYIENYIRCLQTETDFINCFNPITVTALYKKVYKNYRESYFNFCESVLTNAVGLFLLGEDIQNLSVSAEQCNRLSHLFQNKTEEEVEFFVLQCIPRLLKSLGITEKKEVSYFENANKSLVFRLKSAEKYDNFNKIFVFF